MTRSPDPTREVALIALNGSRAYPNDVLREVIEYAFDQLCWSMSDLELDQFLADLKAKMDSDDQPQTGER